MKKILVTGAGGRLGSEVTIALSRLGYSQILLTSRLPKKVLPKAEYLIVDWKDIKLPQISDIDVVIHLAHQTSAYQARNNVEEDINSNVIATIRIIEAIKHSVKPIHFVYMGSLTEYGSKNLNPISEFSKAEDPETFYDCSKLAVELYLKQYQQEELLGTLTILRLGNLYGFLDSQKTQHRGFFDEAISSAFHGKEVLCFGGGDFVRDFIHVDDVVSALIRFIESDPGVANGTFNLASGVGHTLKEALSLIGQSLTSIGRNSIKIKMEEFPVKSYDIERRNHVADISRIKNTISWGPKTTLSQGISQSIHYYLEQISIQKEDI
jgi:nucleoside-diphosphate-sugar epimerase